MREFVLKNGIKACIKRNEDTPRAALTLNISINSEEKIAGQYSLMNRLLLIKTILIILLIQNLHIMIIVVRF